MIAFPINLALRQDSIYYSRTQDDLAIKTKMESGYTHARARSTRRPRKTFTTGFTDISQEEMTQLESFYDKVGAFDTFNWTDPTSGVVYVVRFEGAFKSIYRGAGAHHRYNVTNITLKEA